MTDYSVMSKEELIAQRTHLLEAYQNFKAKQLKLDMSRGKPGAKQLDLSDEMLDLVVENSDFHSIDGTDVRNYGSLEGIAEAKQLFSEILGVMPEEIIVGGNSSLNLMYDSVTRAYTHGVLGSTPWCKLDKVKFLCPSPGYDRHFAICEHYGIEMIPVAMHADGPDMDTIEKLVAEDESMKGIWCVPKYSNPQGITYSDEVVRRFAALNPKAKDFRIFWDNAYCVHDLYPGEEDQLLNLMEELKKNHKENMVYMFTSTSKISFPGAGISAFAASKENLDSIKKMLGIQIISYDKVSQLMHARYLVDLKTTKKHMQKHAEILRPKFEMVLDILKKEFGNSNIISWTSPKGGYFISVDVMEGCAKKVVSLCKEAGVVLTPAGATYPLGKDPKDSNIRIAPTYPPVSELQLAMELFCICVKLASVEKMLNLA